MLTFMESPSAMKNKTARKGAMQVLAGLALRHEFMMAPVVAGLVDALHKHEHLPAVVAELAEASAHSHQDSRLAVALLREV
jgi:hypothetical protein